jgi:uncharacterized protein DUF6328
METLHGKGDRPTGEQGCDQQALKDAVNQCLEEARMVLPGIQALFGFQLVAVFNQRFDTALSSAQQVSHLVALLLTAVSAAFVMTPAAYHRQTQPGSISRQLLRVASRCISVALVPLMAGLCLDVYVVSCVVLQREAVALVLAAATALLLGGLWFVFPWASRWKRTAR